jgi:putative two-component system response regulator
MGSKHLSTLFRYDENELIAKEVKTMLVESMYDKAINSINTFTPILNGLDQSIAVHHDRVSKISLWIAEMMDLSHEQIKSVQIAGMIHDVGKLKIPQDTLNKPSSLNEMETHIIKRHPQDAYTLLVTLGYPLDTANIVLQHHERLDGSGYPFGISGEQICFEAQLLAVADVIDAMSSYRPYHHGKHSLNDILEELTCKKGQLYNREIVGIVENNS